MLDWFAEAEGERLAKAVHTLLQRPPLHPGCRCGVSFQDVNGEQWEVLEPLPGACSLCRALAAARLL